MGEIVYLPAPAEMTEEQRDYWLDRLEAGEREVEDCKRVLGFLAIENGLV